MNLNFEDSAAGQAAVVSVQGRLDGASAGLFEAHCKKQLADLGKKHLIIDMRAVDYLSSAGLRSFLILGKHVKALGGRQAICGLKGMVLETFTISGFLALFPVAETPELAVRMIEGGASPQGASAPPQSR